MLAAWHGSMEVGQPVPNRDFLMGAFHSLGDNRREALKLAAGFRGEEAFEEGVSEERALELVLELLSPPRLMELAARRSSSTSGTAPAPTTDRAFTDGPRRSGQRGADLGDRLLVVAEVDRGHAGPRAPSQLTSTSSTKRQASAGGVEPLQGQLVDLAIPACGSRRSRSRRRSRRSRRPAASRARAAPTPGRCWSASPSGGRSSFSSRISSIIGSFGSSASK